MQSTQIKKVILIILLLTLVGFLVAFFLKRSSSKNESVLLPAQAVAEKVKVLSDIHTAPPPPRLTSQESSQKTQMLRQLRGE
jgi:hypothetical protein